MNTISRKIVLSMLLLLGMASPSLAAVQATHWICWLHDSGVHAVCKLAPEALAPAAVDDPSAGVVPVLPYRDDLRGVGERSAARTGRTLHVPLHNVPFDSSSVHRLMSAVLCGAGAAAQGCTASYHADVGQFAAASPALFTDLNDPLLDLTL